VNARVARWAREEAQYRFGVDFLSLSDEQKAECENRAKIRIWSDDNSISWKLKPNTTTGGVTLLLGSFRWFNCDTEQEALAAAVRFIER
jgi:hypothetical protein